MPSGDESAAPGPAGGQRRAGGPGEVRRVTVTRDGPVLIEGPVEVLLPDGSTAFSDRFVVALCVCRRSRRYPWCDTSHRRAGHRRRADGSDGGGRGVGPHGVGADGGEVPGRDPSGGGPSECQRPQQ